MIIRLTAILALSLFTVPSAVSQDLSGDYLYKVSTIRAATGKLSPLLDWIAELKASDYFETAGEHPPFIMRHSQGDQWDLLIISPMESWASYYSATAVDARDEAMAANWETLEPGYDLIAFDEDNFAYGPSLEAVKTAFESNDFYHIEMFEAAAGKTVELFGQRQMENAYLSSTGQVANMIFRRSAGSDVDVFTIGFHQSLEAFAAPASATDEEKEAAAKAAGFKDRSDISFYLRSLLSGHHDTLAVKVE